MWLKDLITDQLSLKQLEIPSMEWSGTVELGNIYQEVTEIK